MASAPAPQKKSFVSFAGGDLSLHRVGIHPGTLHGGTLPMCERKVSKLPVFFAGARPIAEIVSRADEGSHDNLRSTVGATAALG